MLLSIVSGTWNRMDYLKEMVTSARACIPDGIDYEFVLVDGGSVDGTLEWCRQQTDIRLIEHGALRGALRAFTDGANAASGDYVLLANDDIRFHEHSILPAIMYLETNPSVGAVAFMDNRPAPGYGDGYKVQTMPVRTRYGEQALPYAQVGLFRKWLGDRIGWWGADDPIMGQGSTYGGDNWLSARIYELGYAIVALDHCKIDDMIPNDTLRSHNSDVERRTPGVYYKAFPLPPMMPDVPVVSNPQRERMRVLLATLYEPLHGKYKRGLREAFKKGALVADIDYLEGFDTRGGEQKGKRKLIFTAETWQPHIIFAQMVDADLMRYVRQVAQNAIIVTWNGDVWTDTLYSDQAWQQAQYADLSLMVNFDAVQEYQKRGLNAAYWQVAAEPFEPKATEKSHDILFLGNNYSPAREKFGAFLRSLPYNVGLYGKWGQSDGHTLYDFARSGALYTRCKIAVGDSQHAGYGFVSNRFFEATYHGAFLLHQTIEGMEELTGFVDGVHYVSWTDLDDLKDKIDYYMAHEDERQRIADAGKRFNREHHSFECRVEEFMKLIGEIT